MRYPIPIAIGGVPWDGPASALEWESLYNLNTDVSIATGSRPTFLKTGAGLFKTNDYTPADDLYGWVNVNHSDFSDAPNDKRVFVFITMYDDGVKRIAEKLPSKSKLTGTANADGDIQLDEATGNLADTRIANLNATVSSRATQTSVDTLTGVVTEGVPHYYSPDSGTRTVGTDQGGTVANMGAKDDTSWVTGEVAGTGLDVVVDVATSTPDHVPATLNITGYYAGGAGHSILVYVYDYILSTWVQKLTMLNRSASFDYECGVSASNQNPTTGAMRVRFVHNVGTYIASHRLYLDFVSFGKIESTNQTAADVANIKAKTDQLEFVNVSGSSTVKGNTYAQQDIDFGALQKLSLNAATPASVGAIPAAVLATVQPNYAPAKAGDKMDIVDAPNATAVTAIQLGLSKPSIAQTITSPVDMASQTTLNAVGSAVNNLGSPLQTSTYVAPDNAKITDIKAKTDNLTFTGTNVNSHTKVSDVSGGLTAQQTVDALLLSPSAGTPGANSVFDGLTSIKSKTINLPTSPAAVGSAMTLTSAYDAAKTASQLSRAQVAALLINRVNTISLHGSKELIDSFVMDGNINVTVTYNINNVPTSQTII